MEGEELIITRHLNRAYRSSNGINSGSSLSSASSSCKDEPVTPLARSNSTPNTNTNSLSSGQPPAGSTTPTHLSHGPSSQNLSATSPHPTKLTATTSLSSPLMLSNNNNNNPSTKDEPLDVNNGPNTPTSNMAPPLSSMLQMTNSLQSSSHSPYNPSNNNGTKSSSLSSNLTGSGTQMTSPNLTHMSLSPHHHHHHHHHQQQQQQHIQYHQVRIFI